MGEQVDGVWGDVPLDENLIEAERVLRRLVRSDRVRDVLRRPSARLDGRTLLELARSDTAAVLAHVREMLDLRRLD